jgi:hypothetical protein
MPRLRTLLCSLLCARRALLCAVISLGASACVGTSGSDLFFFDASAAGPLDADPARPFAFTTGRGYRVTLTRAKVHLGAVYLNRAFPVSGAQETSCFLPGLYVAQVTRGLDVDALSPDPQPFPTKGEALEEHAVAAEVALTGGDVSALEDTTVILDVAGAADQDGASYPFEGALTIGTNRAVPANDPSQPGKNPICKQRIVSPIPVDLTPREGGRLLVRVDPRAFFTNVDFAALDKVSDAPPLYRFRDETVEQPNVNLYQGLKAREGAYAFSWIDAPAR